MTLALQGIRVLDLTRLLPGPFCTMLLADMGADVIRVEEIADRGGMGRDSLTPPAPEEEERSAAWNHLGRNKKSLALNLKREGAREVFFRLAKTADVVVEAYRPGVVTRLGVDYEAVSQVNPRIVYCSLSGYGQDGPYRDLPGHDANFLGLAGVLSLIMDSQGAPVIPRVLLADVGGALHAAFGIVCALMARERTGHGQMVDISLADCALSFASVPLARSLKSGTPPDKGSKWWLQHAWKSKDGKFVSTANAESYFFERFCRAVGHEELVPARGDSGPRGQEAQRIVQETLHEKTRDEWMDILRRADTCVAPVLDLPEVPEEPQFQHRGLVLDLHHPSQGQVKQFGFPIRLTETPARFRDFAPRRGQHTNEVLGELGYSAAEIDALREAGVVI